MSSDLDLVVFPDLILQRQLTSDGSRDLPTSACGRHYRGGGPPPAYNLSPGSFNARPLRCEPCEAVDNRTCIPRASRHRLSSECPAIALVRYPFRRGDVSQVMLLLWLPAFSAASTSAQCMYPRLTVGTPESTTELTGRNRQARYDGWNIGVVRQCVDREYVNGLASAIITSLGLALLSSCLVQIDSPDPGLTPLCRPQCEATSRASFRSGSTYDTSRVWIASSSEGLTQLSAAAALTEGA